MGRDGNSKDRQKMESPVSHFKESGKRLKFKGTLLKL